MVINACLIDLINFVSTWTLTIIADRVMKIVLGRTDYFALTKVITNSAKRALIDFIAVMAYGIEDKSIMTICALGEIILTLSTILVTFVALVIDMCKSSRTSNDALAFM